MSDRPLRILIFAYSCGPGEGSESGVGWVWSRLLAQLGGVTVLTRSNNRLPIEQAVPDAPERDNMTFEYVDLPPWARWWKRGSRGVRLYYLLWQFAALRRARRLHREEGFDIVWHLTLANAWLGSTGWLVGPPFVYGPVGGGIGFPWRLAGAVGARGMAYECLRAAARRIARYANPLSALACRRAAAVIALNAETRAWFPRSIRDGVVVLPNFLFEADPRPVERAATHTAFVVARLIPWKGASLAVRAIAGEPRWRLVICGTGPDRARLVRLARRLGVSDRVEFRGKVPREKLLRAARDEADVILHPSLHDDSPLSVLEAIASAIPVVPLAIGGPKELAPENAIPIDGGMERVVRRLRDALAEPDALRLSRHRAAPLRELREIVAGVVDAGASANASSARGGVVGAA